MSTKLVIKKNNINWLTFWTGRGWWYRWQLWRASQWSCFSQLWKSQDRTKGLVFQVPEKWKHFHQQRIFFNHLTNTPCTPNDYNFALNVYEKFKCRNLYDYTILYDHTDTLLLAEIMMVYRKVIQDNFKIDVNHFQGIPALAYNLMLR